MKKQKYMPPHHIYFKDLLHPASFRFIIVPLFALLLFIFDILELPLYLAVIIFFLVLFLWRDSEKNYFVNPENKKGDLIEIFWWIVALSVTILLIESSFN